MQHVEELDEHRAAVGSNRVVERPKDVTVVSSISETKSAWRMDMSVSLLGGVDMYCERRAVPLTHMTHLTHWSRRRQGFPVRFVAAGDTGVLRSDDTASFTSMAHPAHTAARTTVSAQYRIRASAPQSHPRSTATRTASWRLSASVLPIADER